MERIILMLAAAAVIALAGYTGWTALNDPLAANRTALAGRLDEVPSEISRGAQEASDYSEAVLALRRKGKVWDGLVPPPPPKAAAPVPPDLGKLLKDVKGLRGQVGDKVKMQLPGKARPEWVSIGSKIKGCTLKSFDDDKVVFSLFWKEGNKELTFSIKRE